MSVRPICLEPAGTAPLGVKLLQGRGCRGPGLLCASGGCRACALEAPGHLVWGTLSLPLTRTVDGGRRAQPAEAGHGLPSARAAAFPPSLPSCRIFNIRVCAWGLTLCLTHQIYHFIFLFLPDQLNNFLFFFFFLMAKTFLPEALEEGTRNRKNDTSQRSHRVQLQQPMQLYSFPLFNQMFPLCQE